MERANRDRAPTGQGGARPTPACPYLGLKSDPATVYMLPTDNHQCYGVNAPQPIDLSHQASFCLDHFEACPLFVAASHSTPQSTASSPSALPPPLPHPAPSTFSSLKPRAGLSLALAALLVAALVVAFGQVSPARQTQVRLTLAPGAALLSASPTRAPSATPIAPTPTSMVVAADTSPTLPLAVRPNLSPSAPAPSPNLPLAGRATLRSVTPATLTPALPTPAPTLAPSPLAPTATPSAVVVTVMPIGSPTVAALLPLVVQAEAALVSGEFEAALDLGSGSSAVTQVRFHLGDGGQAPGLHLLTTYTSGPTTQTIERLTIGDRSWQRQPNGAWAPIPEQEGVWGQVQAVLPRARSVTDVTQESSEKTGVLRWYDPNRSADVTLQVDPTTGVPREMQQVTRGLFARRTIVYRGWNTPVAIPTPSPP